MRQNGELVRPFWKGSWPVAHKQGDLPTSPFLIRSASLEAIRDATTIRAAAHAEAAEIKTVALREAAALHIAEVERGRSESAMAVATLIAAAEVAIATFWTTREAELMDLVLAVAHRVIGTMTAEAQLAALVHTALAEHQDEVGLVLRTSASNAVMLRSALASLGRSELAVEADALLADAQCILVHRRGRTSLGLIEQFRELIADQR